MTNRTLNVGDIVLDTRYNIYEIVEEINYNEDLIIVRGMFNNDGDKYNYGFKAFYRIYQIISSIGD